MRKTKVKKNTLYASDIIPQGICIFCNSGDEKIILEILELFEGTDIPPFKKGILDEILSHHISLSYLEVKK